MTVATLFLVTMVAFLAAFVFFTMSSGTGRAGLYGIARKTCWVAFFLAIAGILLRWMEVGHPPLSNMFESLVTLGTFLGGATLFFTWNRPLPLVEAAASAIVVLMIGISSLFPDETGPLVPVLQSYWLPIHVSIAFLGEACFTLAFALGYLFFLRCFLCRKGLSRVGTPGEKDEVLIREGKSAIEGDGTIEGDVALEPFAGLVVFGLPLLLSVLLVWAAFWSLSRGGLSLRSGLLLGAAVPLVIASLSLMGGILFRREAMASWVGRVLPPEEHLDEYIYRAISLGYPLFTVGGLIFGMVWAHRAWGRYWGWDPKETWSLITFLVYSAYLHLRLGKGWRGLWLAGMAVLGFLVTMFTLFGVNLLLSGLHSYAMGG